jgi:hypothetical protein
VAGYKGMQMPCQGLRDIRYVARTADTSKDTPGQKALRRLMETQPEKFAEKMTRLEEQHRTVSARVHERLSGGKPVQGKREAAAPAPLAAPAEAVDDGERRARDLVAELLAEWKRVNGNPSPAKAGSPASPR